MSNVKRGTITKCFFYNAVVLSELTNAPPAVNTNKHNAKLARGHNVSGKYF